VLKIFFADINTKKDSKCAAADTTIRYREELGIEDIGKYSIEEYNEASCKTVMRCY
jgi:hypothetical protein